MAIPLTIYKNGRNNWSQETEGIHLNNQGNTHWTSFVPQHYCNRKYLVQNPPKNAFQKNNIGMTVLKGFIFALGIAAVAFAFVALNACSGGLAGVLVASAAAATTGLSGKSLFFSQKPKNGAAIAVPDSPKPTN